MLYGSLTTSSYLFFSAEEPTRLVRWFGAETLTSNLSGLPCLPLSDPADPDPRERPGNGLSPRRIVEGMVWYSVLSKEPTALE